MLVPWEQGTSWRGIQESILRKRRRRRTRGDTAIEWTNSHLLIGAGKKSLGKVIERRSRWVVAERYKAQCIYHHERLIVEHCLPAPIVSRHNGILNLIMIEELEERSHVQFKRDDRCLKRFIAQTVAQPVDREYFMTRFNKSRNYLKSALLRRHLVHFARLRTNSDCHEGGQSDLVEGNQLRRVSRDTQQLYHHTLPILPT